MIVALRSVEQAAEKLEVTSRRVRQMLADGTLEGQRVGAVWVIDERALWLAAQRRRAAHRPWNPSSAWAVLALADGAEPGCTPAQRSRARRRLAAGLANLVGPLASRAHSRWFYAHPSVVSRLAARPGIVRTAASASPEYHLGLVGSWPLEAYLRQSDLEVILDEEAMEERTERFNLLLRVVEDRIWPFGQGSEVAPRPVVAVDLLESDDERARRAGAELLGRL